ncbi:GNAT family N-acetyltransferase [Paracoccus sp. 1_MG-2023]|uniref:GNAT family N-acetyltransferase n=1 Tax=unclassified Paracoccus (in: a-proteobacteria) TaxID=2688777 RepID=UPI001C09B08E|nr:MULTISPECIES: GNAT family N-acetyltransferase [unclassified Paracoccus (in: a-proteobacteria)]MBU2956682.1 GNAT family N-acetyltransferase [Paracoccus sp. C2R09]MDO6668787.1 GNAT family N-acetyltransferase [Paracoccus sp. 1_MG-2023]
MTCACGQNHATGPHDCDGGGAPVALPAPMIALTGRLVCADAGQMMTVLGHVQDHVDLSRAEAGNLRFDLWQDDDPLIWHLSELFRDEAAFAAHRARTADSIWGHETAQIARDFDRHEVMPALRPEQPSDRDPIDSLLAAAFDGPSEAALVRQLRADEDLSLSLVAIAAGRLLGHLALSPIAADRPALALAPVAVHPRAQGLGIGSALIRAALDHAGDRPVVVLGDPAYYSRFGFRPADLKSPYAGPCLQVAGDLPDGTTIAHAPAFATI